MENVGVIVRPESEVGPAPGRSAALRRLRTEGVGRARLLEYSGESIAKVATGLGYTREGTNQPKLVVSIPDAEVEAFGSDYNKSIHFALTVGPWIQRQVVELILVGVTPPSGVGADVRWMAALATATQNVAKACAEYNASAPVSTSFSLSVLRSSFPPSASLFAAPGPLGPILSHLRSSGAPFVIELDPYLAWRQSYYDISLDYALFGPEYSKHQNMADMSPEFIDGNTEYWNLFDAMLDAVRWALFREGYQDLDVLVGSVGWPSGYSLLPNFGIDQKLPPAATPAYAAKFNSRLARHLNCTRSLIPGAAIDARGCAKLLAYIFEADDVTTAALTTKQETTTTSANLEAFESMSGAEPEENSDNTKQDYFQLHWGIADAVSGRLKYSLRTGEVLTIEAPLHRIQTDNKDCASPGCFFLKLFSPASAISLAALAALLLAAIILLMSLLATLLKICCSGHSRTLRNENYRRRAHGEEHCIHQQQDANDTNSSTKKKNTHSRIAAADTTDTTHFLGEQRDPLIDLPEENPLSIHNGHTSDNSWLYSNVRPLFNFALGPPRKKPTFSRHTADSVASIIRTTRHTAAENLRDDRRSRGFRTGFGLGGGGTPFDATTTRSSYLRAIAESPIQSETDDESSVLSDSTSTDHHRNSRQAAKPAHPLPVIHTNTAEPRSSLSGQLASI